MVRTKSKLRFYLLVLEYMHALADKKKGEQQKIVSVEEPSTSGNSSFVARKNSDFKKQSAAVIAARNMKTV